MKVYLINNETNEIVNEYSNVISWGFNFVEYDNGGRCKIYCDSEVEHFSNEEPVKVEVTDDN